MKKKSSQTVLSKTLAEACCTFIKNTQTSLRAVFLFLQVSLCGSKSICVVVFVMTVKYTLGNEVNETYKMKFASS